jgi:hypothetical protein
MGVCESCGLEMTTAPSCDVTHASIGGELLERVPYLGPGERCHDCNVLVGGYHHGGCDMEVCPRCGDQMIGCDCLDCDPDEEDDERGDEST